MIGLSMLLPQNQPIVAEIMTHASPVKVGSFVAKTASFGSFVEFLINPLCGALGDKYGRRPIILFAFSTTAVLRAVAFVNSRSLPIVGITLVVTRALDTVLITATRAALSDMLSGEQLAFALPKIATAAGLAIMFGPPISLGITRLTGSHTLPLLAASVVSALCAYTVYTKLDETLPPSRSRDLTWRTANPFAFVEVLTSSATMAKLMSVSLVQTFVDQRSIADTAMSFQQSQLGWTREESGQYVVAAGVKIVLGGIIGKQLIKYMGLRNITSWSNGINSLVAALFATIPHYSIYILFFGMLGDRKRDGVESMLTDIGTTGKGFGRGRIASALFNWRSLANIIAPLLYNSLFQWGLGKKKATGVQYFASSHQLACLSCSLIAEMIYRSIPSSDIDGAVAINEKKKQK